MVEHGTENAGVDSSSLSLGTTPLFLSPTAFALVSFALPNPYFLTVLLNKFIVP